MSLTVQETLTKERMMVLDTTCSDKKIWPRFASLRIDIRRDVKPDICASAAYLPFRPGLFSHLYCDPPHMIRTDMAKLSERWQPKPRLIREKSGYMRIRDRHQKPRAIDLLRFGAWKTREEWTTFLERINSEFVRVLGKDGRLFFKIASGNDKRMVNIADLQTLTNFKETYRKELKSRAPWSKNITYYLTFTVAGEAV